MVSKPPGAARTPKIHDSRSAQKSRKVEKTALSDGKQWDEVPGVDFWAILGGTAAWRMRPPQEAAPAPPAVPEARLAGSEPPSFAQTLLTPK